MAWRLPNRFAAVARGECDRCGFEYPHKQLRKQAYYNGTKLTATGWMVCPSCYDEDYPKNAHKDFSDPKPLQNPRPAQVANIYTCGWQIDGHTILIDGHQICTSGEPAPDLDETEYWEIRGFQTELNGYPVVTEVLP